MSNSRPQNLINPADYPYVDYSCPRYFDSEVEAIQWVENTASFAGRHFEFLVLPVYQR